MFKFIHSSDLHLGKPFGRFPEDVRVRLRQARAETLPRLASLAREHGAGHILLAGDTFDQTTPAPAVIRQALNRMREAEDVTWVVMPGNHDHANATELWRQVARDAPPNVVLLLQPEPFALNAETTLLPAPPTERHPGRDLTEWFDSAETADRLRIGLAHGSVTEFDNSEDGGSSVIAPDRARRAGLAYLGLGDWHGQLQIGPETWYSGAPEADGFKHSETPAALLVELPGKTAPARVTSLPTGVISWRRVMLELSDDPADRNDCTAAHEALLPSLPERASTLFDLVVSGRAKPLDRVALENAIAGAAPDFLWHRADLSALGLVHDTTDLDAIDRQGALRAAAEALAREAEDESLPPETRETAQAALSHLFSLALEA
ncbi:metallophosphoesterase [Labrenzia sp. 011]|uniref:metallophosphoesterase family protein n=1 Tax=Labrenzia sp. 011 TaxID=2171494 RepID=UPI000D50B7C7|nr:metallophosphoesterase [Labrenzia sp. 011]PVB60970.1 DNA repair exonuclease [Labrenzia sp. 011]